MQPLRIEKVVISDVGPFESLTVDFPQHTGLSLICGDNGIGKTTILEGITAAFSNGNIPRLTRRQAGASGSVNVQYRVGEQQFNPATLVTNFEPDKPNSGNGTSGEHAKSVISVRALRDFPYIQQPSISRDPSFNDFQYGVRNASSPGASEIKSWFTNRYLMRPHAEVSGWTPQMIENLESAVSFFSLLDPSVTLERVDTRTFDIIVSTPSGTIPFEYLSSGFRSAYTLLLGILKEIEFRELGVSASSFTGLIVIDELDLHLHPIWQQQIGGILKEAFPNAQIIATTHSPHIVQVAQPSEVIALAREPGGDVHVRSVPTSEYGYTGWTLEEVLEDIMGVTDTRTPIYREVMEQFDDALDRDDAIGVLRAKEILLKMLHPNNSLRKLIEIQAAPYVGTDLNIDDADSAYGMDE